MMRQKLITALLFIFTVFGGQAWGREMPWEEWGLELHGFLDGRYGMRTGSDKGQRQTSLAESRLQLEAFRAGDYLTLQLRSDFLYDDVAEDSSLDFEDGQGPVDLREANLLFTPLDIMDVKVGRQILTWGTGDLLFINDLFPKDWQSFFIGRDEEYLKAPSDALMVSLFPAFANIDLVYTPRFDADRYIRGERLSYFNRSLDRRAGRDAVIAVDKPDDWFTDDEFSLRVSKDLGGYELALYGYNGFWKSPEGMNPVTMQGAFPSLSVYGLSVRGALGEGLFHVEGGYYDSREDRAGDDPLVPNSERRLLIGYERELARDFSASLQYYLEYMEDHDAYLASASAARARDRDRHVLTLRLTRQAFSQNLTLSLFTYYSPTDQDGYVRPTVKYKLTDAWLLTAGANLFFGSEDHTFFSQFEQNSNLYVGLRYSF